MAIEESSKLDFEQLSNIRWCLLTGLKCLAEVERVAAYAKELDQLAPGHSQLISALLPQHPTGCAGDYAAFADALMIISFLADDACALEYSKKPSDPEASHSQFPSRSLE